MTVTKPVLRYHGAKFRIAGWVLQFFPVHRVYVEPFGGAGGVLLQKPRAYAEVYNDLDGDVVNFFRVLRDPEQRAKLIEAVQLTPYARAEFDQAWEPTADPVEAARRLAIRAQMGFGSAGASKGTTGFRIDTKRAYGTSQQHWAEYPEAIAAAGKRLTGILIDNAPAIEVMDKHDDPDTLHFVDPPYVHATRVGGAGKARYYRHEMTDEQHAELLAAIRNLRGMVVITGYDTPLYRNALADWELHQTTARISAGRGGAVRTECAWVNPACSRALRREHGGLFRIPAMETA